MKQRICIGIQQLDESWTAILNQIGVWFEEVDYSRDIEHQYSVIILNRKPGEAAQRQLHTFLKQGGAVLEMKGIHPFLHDHHIRKQDIKTVINKSDNPIFRHIPLLDICSEVELHEESPFFRGLIHFQVWKRGLIGFFGIDLPKLLSRTGYQRKKFYSESGANPDEIVSKVSKHKLMQAFEATLKQLHFRQSLPFVQKWTSPSTQPVFCFRIDTDFGDKDSIDTLYNLQKKHSIKGTWFLHVKAHEDWIDHFKKMEHQELALHGYEHGTSKSYSKTRQNIQQGLEVLQDHDISVKGFCAPYGIWNEALEKSLPEFDFQYTSEFTMNYDGFPFTINPRLPLQIPIHPICTGSLSRKRYSAAKMAAYFARILETKTGRFEPVLFYHHPLQPGLKVLDHVFELVNNHKLHPLTFSEFIEFWKEREALQFEVFVEDDQVQINAESSPKKFLISNSHFEFTLTEANRSVNFQKTNDFQYTNSYLPDAQAATNLRKPDIRLMKTSLLDWKNRGRL